MAAKMSPTGMACKPIEKKIGSTAIKLEHGDLTALPVDAWVFYAREDLDIGSGYGTAIQMRGGVAVRKELEKIGSIKMGEAVITTAGEMKAKHIIHACGPKFQEPDLEKKLADCMMSVLRVADENGLKVVAFPPMGTGFYGVPLNLSAKIMLDTMIAFLKFEANTSLGEIIICVNDYRDYVPFREKMESM